MCHQSVSLAARYLEQHGIATVVMGCARDIVEHCGVPRFVFSDFPLGNAAGRPFDEDSQRITLWIALDLLVAEIVKEHRIELDHARVRARVETIASTYQDSARVLDWYYSDRERLSGIESLVFEDQVVEWILERAQVTDEPTSFDRILNPGQTDATAT